MGTFKDFQEWTRRLIAGDGRHATFASYRPKRRELILLLACYGLAAGCILAVLPDIRATGSLLGRNTRIILSSLAGAAIGSLIIPVYQRLTATGRGLLVESAEVSLLGSKISIKLTNRDRVVGWKLFVEAATRITTQPLGANEGLLREALTSIYQFFKLVRDELKAAGASPHHADARAHTLETYAVLMLNDAMRPFLSRWHPRLLAWEKTGRPESQWPLNDACRRDLDVARRRLLGYTWGLGEMLAVAKLADLLPAKPQGNDLNWLTGRELSRLENGAGLDAILSDTQRPQVWRIFVETTTRACAQHGLHEGALRQALTSFEELFSFVRTELKDIPTGAPTIFELAPAAERASASRPERNANAVNSPCAFVWDGAQTGMLRLPNPNAAYLHAMKLLNTGLRPLLSRWHPRLLAWEKTGRPESQWPLNHACRRDLEVASKIVLIHLWCIGELLRVPGLNCLLPERPQESEAALTLRWTPHAEIGQIEEKMRAAQGDAAKNVGWRIFVELASRAPKRPLESQASSIREAIDSLQKLYEVVRDELKPLGVEHLSTGREGDGVERIALEVLNGVLRSFLDKWHPLLLDWEAQNKDESGEQDDHRVTVESEWGRAKECLRELEGVHADLDAKASRLGKVVGIADADKLLSVHD